MVKFDMKLVDALYQHINYFFILGKNNKPRVTAGNSIKTLSKYANPIKKQRYFISTCNLNVVQYFMSDVSTSLRVIPMSPQITARWL